NKAKSSPENLQDPARAILDQHGSPKLQTGLTPIPPSLRSLLSYRAMSMQAPQSSAPLASLPPASPRSRQTRFPALGQAVQTLGWCGLVGLPLWLSPLALAQSNAPGAIEAPSPTRSNTPPTADLTPFSLEGSLNRTSPSSSPVTANYLLGPGDQLQMAVFDVPEYGQQMAVLDDGSVMLPEGVSLAVAGMTLDQAKRAIEQAISPIVRHPRVTLSLLKARSLKVAIAGEVKKPGVYTFESLLTLTQALQSAGGVTPGANFREIQVRRLQPQGRGGRAVLTANLWEVINTGALEQDLLLQDGDTIVIPTATDLNLAEAQRIATATFAMQPDETIQVAVLGQVQRPGTHTLSGEIQTVSAAIQAAGGITQEANVREIEVQRTTIQGEKQVIALDFWKLLQEGDIAQDLPLRPGDSVIIPQAAVNLNDYNTLALSTLSPDTIAINVVGEVKRPGTLEVSPNTPLIQALLAAGGFNDDASRGSVELVRLNPDGTVSQRRIEVDLAQGLDVDENPPLKPNDTILVARSGAGNFRAILRGLVSPVTGVFSIFRLLGL
ncbi:MAG: SLBB domain-containing protein, partial [Prochlorothrix sp.]